MKNKQERGNFLHRITAYSFLRSHGVTDFRYCFKNIYLVFFVP